MIRRFSTNLVKTAFTHGTSVILIRVTSVLSSFAILAVAARVFEPESYGLFGLGFAWYTITSVLLDLGASFQLPNEFQGAHRNRDMDSFIAANLLSKVALAAAILLLGLFVFLFLKMGLPFFLVFVAGVTAALPRSFFETLGWRTFAGEKPLRALPYFFLSPFSLLLALGWSKGMTSVAQPFFASAILSLVVLVVTHKTFLSKAFVTNLQSLNVKQYLRGALPYAGYALVGVLFTQTDVFFVSSFLGIEAAGRFQLASRIIFAVEILAVGLSTSFLVHFARQRQQHGSSSLAWQGIFYVFAFGSLVAGFVWLLSDIAIRIMGGGNYPEAAEVLRFMACSVPFRFVSHVLSNLMTSNLKHAQRLTLSLTASLILFLLYSLLIPRFALEGAGMAILIASFLQTLLFLVVLRRMSLLGQR
jgi:O-antigen/teichoic acid export membrane protein